METKRYHPRTEQVEAIHQHNQLKDLSEKIDHFLETTPNQNNKRGLTDEAADALIMGELEEIYKIARDHFDNLELSAGEAGKLDEEELRSFMEKQFKKIGRIISEDGARINSAELPKEALEQNIERLIAVYQQNSADPNAASS